MKDCRRRSGMISIHGSQLVGGIRERVDLFTAGSYAIRDGNFLITYDESGVSGFPNCRTTLCYEPVRNQVTLRRNGAFRSELIVEKGRRHQCTYECDDGTFVLGVSGDSVESSLSENGGELSFRYSLDFNTMLASENGITVSVSLPEKARKRLPGGSAESPAEKERRP